jgi:hypothetical protein
MGRVYHHFVKNTCIINLTAEHTVDTCFLMGLS